jgi:hypothetical protein
MHAAAKKVIEILNLLLGRSAAWLGAGLPAPPLLHSDWEHILKK